MKSKPVPTFFQMFPEESSRRKWLRRWRRWRIPNEEIEDRKLCKRIREVGALQTIVLNKPKDVFDKKYSFINVLLESKIAD
jgi:hypothetical protein